MRISGLQKLTLLDYPDRVACTLFTPGCNFRCPFCHNAGLVLPAGQTDTVTEEEVLSFLARRRGILTGVCITGGEPTLQHGLADFLARVKEFGYAVKLDTNGSRPAVLRSLVEGGLVDMVAMDIKHTPAKYGEAAGLTDCPLSEIEESVAFLLAGSLPFEFRTTVVRELHTPADFAEIGRWIAGAPRYFLQCFKDSGDLLSTGWSAPDNATLQACLAAVLPYVPAAALRGV